MSQYGTGHIIQQMYGTGDKGAIMGTVKGGRTVTVVPSDKCSNHGKSKKMPMQKKKK